jgi:hypothetical protein
VDVQITLDLLCLAQKSPRVAFASQRLFGSFFDFILRHLGLSICCKKMFGMLGCPWGSLALYPLGKEVPDIFLIRGKIRIIVRRHFKIKTNAPGFIEYPERRFWVKSDFPARTNNKSCVKCPLFLPPPMV